MKPPNIWNISQSFVLAQNTIECHPADFLEVHDSFEGVRMPLGMTRVRLDNPGFVSPPPKSCDHLVSPHHRVSHASSDFQLIATRKNDT